MKDQLTKRSVRVFHSHHLRGDPHVSDLGSHGAALGTPHYMAPEQWRGEQGMVPASDVFSFGVVLFEIFAGTNHLPHVQPVAGPNSLGHDICASHVQGPHFHLLDESVSALTRGPLTELTRSSDASDADGANLARQVGELLDQLISRCLLPEPEQRPTAQEILDDLADLETMAGIPPMTESKPLPVTSEAEATFWNNLANTYGHIGQHDEQERLAKKALACAPDDPELWGNLASAQSMNGHPVDAEASFEQAEKRLQMLQPGQYTTPVLQQAEDSNSRHAILLYSWGAALDKPGKYQEAIDTYSRSLALDPTSASARYAMGASYVSLADAASQAGNSSEQLRYLRDAAAEFTRVLALHPEYSAARNALVRVQKGTRDLEQAFEDAAAPTSE